MKRLWLWGAGSNLEAVMDYIRDDVKINGIFDRNTELHGKKVRGVEIMAPEIGRMADDDMILITVTAYEDVAEDAKKALNVQRSQIVPFWDEDYEIDRVADFMDVNRWKSEIGIPRLKWKIKNLKLELENKEYEIAEKILSNPPVFPVIKEGLEALNAAYYERKSICRYGDGEFEIILGRSRTKLQKTEKELSKRLYEIINTDSENVLICIADLYGSLDDFTEIGARGCRDYLTPDVRKDHMSVIDINKIYYDAYVSRPYITKKDKSKAAEIFKAWRKLWDGKDVVIVEGIFTRCGYKNDLLSNTKSLQRVLCPPTDSWKYYKEILRYIKENVSQDKLVLIALGPAATVLAYDLAQTGYQAIDMGHLDNEYEWYLRGKMENLEYKYMNSLGEEGRKVTEIFDEEYNGQVLVKIGC